MIDRREAILARLFVLIGSVSGIKSAVRNRGLLDNDVRPATVLMDGDEQERTPRVGRNLTGRGAMTPVMMTLRPQIFVVMDTRLPQNASIGTDLNAIRTALIEALAGDATLLSLVGSNGDIVYNGLETDLKSGSSLDGQARLDFSITYPLDPN